MTTTPNLGLNVTPASETDIQFKAWRLRQDGDSDDSNIMKLDAEIGAIKTGKADLDENGQVPLEQINDSLIGNVNYQGVWDASTGLDSNGIGIAAASEDNKGYYYVTSVEGTFEDVYYDAGDWLISNGTSWDKVKNTDAVVSVNGKIGAVAITQDDVGLGNVDNTRDADKPISTAMQAGLDAIQEDLDAHADDADIHVTAQKQATWDADIDELDIDILTLKELVGTMNDNLGLDITSYLNEILEPRSADDFLEITGVLSDDLLEDTGESVDDLLKVTGRFADDFWAIIGGSD